MTDQSKKLSNLFIFDIDGVLTDPISKKVNQKLLSLISDLADTMPIIFNTGRSAAWVINNILPYIKTSTSHASFYVACEMGAVSLTLDSEGKTKIDTNQDALSQQVPDQLRNTIIDMVSQNYNNSMFVDTSKKVIMTVEMQDNYPIEKFDIDRDEIKNSIEIILKHYHPSIHVRPSSSTIAIDIKPTHLNKANGAKMIHQWLIKHNYDLSETDVQCFGDSESDIEMCDYFSKQNIMTSFVYVGEDKLTVIKSYKIIKTDLLHSDGTHNYLKTVV